MKSNRMAVNIIVIADINQGFVKVGTGLGVSLLIRYELPLTNIFYKVHPYDSSRLVEQVKIPIKCIIIT